MRVTVVTPSSPVGRALLGRRAGDDVEVLQRGARREGTIVAVG
jgi:transcription elongation GreA/GreB family factor